VAASVVTFFTFLPSFVFILMGGPLIESTQGNLKLTAPLTAITAAVVGVILSLALFFAMHVFLPPELPRYMATTLGIMIDWTAVVLAIFGFVALYKFKVSIIKLILAFSLLGFLLMFLN
jgi:chromate transporter